MKLPPDIEFHEDIRLLIYRPKGLINEAEINRVIGVIEGMCRHAQNFKLAVRLKPSPSTRLLTSKECAQRVFHEHLNFVALFAVLFATSKLQTRAELEIVTLHPSFISELRNVSRAEVEVTFSYLG